MIGAFVFDLDGTLVQTESLKARSYARAAASLRPGAVVEQAVLDAFKDVVGMSRREVANVLMERFALESEARARMAELGADSAWEAFLELRLRVYEEMLDDPAILRDHLCPHNTALLREVRVRGYRTGLATMSHRDQASRVLEILDLTQFFDCTATRDDVQRPKPHPEIYQFVSVRLGKPPGDCIVIEDSPAGVRAALAAGMDCIAVTNDYTRETIHAAELLDPRWIVDDLAALEAVADEAIALKAGV